MPLFCGSSHPNSLPWLPCRYNAITGEWVQDQVFIKMSAQVTTVLSQLLVRLTMKCAFHISEISWLVVSDCCSFTALWKRRHERVFPNVSIVKFYSWACSYTPSIADQGTVFPFWRFCIRVWLPVLGDVETVTENLLQKSCSIMTPFITDCLE